jgi:hypothetical protein
MPGGQVSKGLRGHEQLDVEEAGRIGAVIGPAVLGDDCHHLRAPAQDLPDSGHHRLAPPERDGGRQRRPDPEIPLLQVRQELRAEPGREHEDDRE